MSAEKYYRRRVSVPVEAQKWDAVDGILLPKTSIPFATDLSLLSRFVMDGEVEDESVESPQLVQVYDKNQRTFGVQFGNTEQILFEDEYHNIFSVLDLKGNVSPIIQARRMPHSPSGFSIWGMQESDSIVRALKASDYLRSKEIETEIILGVTEPKQIPYQGQVYSPEEFKTQLLVDALSVDDATRTEESLAPSEIPLLATALEGMEFVQTLRGKQIHERVFDINDASPEVMQKMIDKAFWFLNYCGRQVKDFKPFDPNSEKDINVYFRRILPWSIGRNYGLLHDAGVVHEHPHLQNISLIGGIYDVDSMFGAPLGIGDREITDDDCMKDMSRLLYGYWGAPEGVGLVPFMKDSEGKFPFPDNDSFYFGAAVEANTILSYVYQRDWDRDLLSHTHQLYDLLDNERRAPFSLISGYLLKLLKKSGWDYDIRLDDPEPVSDEIFARTKDYWIDVLNNEPNDYALAKGVFLQVGEVGEEVLGPKILAEHSDAFSSIKDTHGQESADATLNLVRLNLSTFLPLQIADRMFGDDTKNKNTEQAIAYVKSKVGM